MILNSNDLTLTHYNEDKKAIRIICVDFKKQYENQEEILQKYIRVSCPLLLPKGMSIDDACKIVSFWQDKVKSDKHLRSQNIPVLINKVLSRFGFKIIDGYLYGQSKDKDKFDQEQIIQTNINKIDDVLDLICVGGDNELFKQSDLFERYFDWYTPNISFKDIQSIYTDLELPLTKYMYNKTDLTL